MELFLLIKLPSLCKETTRTFHDSSIIVVKITHKYVNCFFLVFRELNQLWLCLPCSFLQATSYRNLPEQNWLFDHLLFSLWKLLFIHMWHGSVFVTGYKVCDYKNICSVLWPLGVFVYQLKLYIFMMLKRLKVSFNLRLQCLFLKRLANTYSFSKLQTNSLN